jgi:hypothetical protein
MGNDAAMTALFSRKQPGGVYTIQDLEAHPGTVRFVDSSHAACEDALGGGRSPDKPFATLAYALTYATTLTPALAAGDVIYLMPGHTETIAAAGGITCATAGVKIIGLGWGANRPTFTFSATASTWLITAASVYIKNIRVKSGVAEVVNMFTISAAGWTLDTVDHIAAGAYTTIQFLLTTADGDYGTLRNCHLYMNTTPAATSGGWITFVGSDYTVMEDNIIVVVLKNEAASFTLGGITTASLGLVVRRNIIYQSGGTTQDLVVSMYAGSTGMYCDNRSFGDVGTLAASIALANMSAAVSYQATAVNKHGIIDPVVA